ncbi:MAG: hypothetical protein OXU26_03395 [Acidobacteriota bacterium]|nr:hypothetical protein [Acidobacteriota bacterium]
MEIELIVQVFAGIGIACLCLWFILWFPTAESERLGKPEWLTSEFWKQDFPPIYHKRLRNILILFIAGNAIAVLAGFFL